MIQSIEFTYSELETLVKPWERTPEGYQRDLVTGFISQDSGGGLTGYDWL